MAAVPRGGINHEPAGPVRPADVRYDRDPKRARTDEGHNNSDFGGPMPYAMQTAATGGPGIAIGGPAVVAGGPGAATGRPGGSCGPGSSGGPQLPLDQRSVGVELIVASCGVGAVIGRGGSTMKRICATSGAQATTSYYGNHRTPS